MKFAVFSDIHNHTRALETVVADAQNRSVDAMFCLGDVGIDSCVDLLRQADVPTVFGNWEVSNWRHLSTDNREWAMRLPPMRKLDGFWLTHAGPFWPPKIKTLADLESDRPVRMRANLFPYLHFEEDSLWKTIALLTEMKIPLMFHGHTHRQLGWRFTHNNTLQRLYGPNIELLPGETCVVGVGSVGRPQDGPGFCYALFDSKTRVVSLLRV